MTKPGKNLQISLKLVHKALYSSFGVFALKGIQFNQELKIHLWYSSKIPLIVNTFQDNADALFNKLPINLRNTTGFKFLVGKLSACYLLKLRSLDNDNFFDL